MENKLPITSNDDLIQMIKEGYFFNFCIGFALNKGFKDAIKERKEVSFMVGDYQVKFIPDSMCFELSYKLYFARVIMAHYHGVEFVGDSEEEVIAELLAEFEKELLTKHSEQ